MMQELFDPQSIAIVGVSPNGGKPGYWILENLLKYGYQGRIYPVHHSATEVMGLPAYPNIKAVPHDVDTVISLAPPEDTMEVVEQAAKKGARGLIIIAGGFGEGDDDGKRLEERVVARANELGMRVMGPNVMGPVNLTNDFVINIAPAGGPMTPGGVAVVAQTGQLCTMTLDWLFSAIHLGISKSIDLGNKSDVSDADVIDYLETDTSTKVIVVHVEGVQEGTKFLQAAKRVSRKKPMIVLKTGRSDAGAKAAASHSGSLAGDAKVFDAALKQAGAIGARNLDEMADFAKAFSLVSVPKGNRTAIVTLSGASGVMAADACVGAGITVADLSEETIQKLVEINPPWVRVGNPIDLGASVPLLGWTKSWKIAMEIAIDEPNVDSIIGLLPVWIKPTIDYDTLAQVLKKGGKPAVVWLIGRDDKIDEASKCFESRGIPVFPSIERSVAALGALCKYGAYQETFANMSYSYGTGE